jgi:pyruvate formate lyase activating enzyme
MPLLKGVNDGSDEIQALIRFLLPYREYRNFKGIDLLPYHRMGVGKYGQLGWDYTLDAQQSLTDADLERLSGWFAAHNFEVAVIRH